MRIDFPRVPLTTDKNLFRALCEKGAELVGLHLLESPKVNEFITRFPVSGDNVVEKVRFEEVRVGAGLAPARSAHAATTEREGALRLRSGQASPFRASLQGEPSPTQTGRVWINRTQYFEGVPKAVWEFHIGGYQVCEKWLKDRKGRKLANDDLAHYQKVVVALDETIRVMREIDDVIPGWPLP